LLNSDEFAPKVNSDQIGLLRLLVKKLCELRLLKIDHSSIPVIAADNRQPSQDVPQHFFAIITIRERLSPAQPGCCKPSLLHVIQNPSPLQRV
jgi:hypothetical protein